MTQKENAIKVLHNLPKGTVLSKHEYSELKFQLYRESKRTEQCSAWDYIIANPQNYGVERVIEHYTTTTSKVNVLDVIEMMKQGYTVEQIEAKVYTQVKVVKIKII